MLVSNFYGNIQTILKDFGLYAFFDDIIESSVVGVRKPDPAIYRLGVEAWDMKPVKCWLSEILSRRMLFRQSK